MMAMGDHGLRIIIAPSPAFAAQMRLYELRQGAGAWDVRGRGAAYRCRILAVGFLLGVRRLTDRAIRLCLSGD